MEATIKGQRSHKHFLLSTTAERDLLYDAVSDNVEEAADLLGVDPLRLAFYLHDRAEREG